MFEKLMFFRYNLFFEAKKSYSMRGDVAMDDFAMSPQCFGIGGERLKGSFIELT